MQDTVWDSALAKLTCVFSIVSVSLHSEEVEIPLEFSQGDKAYTMILYVYYARLLTHARFKCSRRSGALPASFRFLWGSERASLSFLTPFSSVRHVYATSYDSVCLEL